MADDSLLLSVSLPWSAALGSLLLAIVSALQADLLSMLSVLLLLSAASRSRPLHLGPRKLGKENKATGRAAGNITIINVQLRSGRVGKHMAICHATWEKGAVP